MKYKPLGKTGLMTSELGFGAWTIGSDWWGHIDDEAALRMLERAFDLGINFFDTADQYGEGRSERLIGQAFAGRRIKSSLPANSAMTSTLVTGARGTASCRRTSIQRSCVSRSNSRCNGSKLTTSTSGRSTTSAWKPCATTRSGRP